MHTRPRSNNIAMTKLQDSQAGSGSRTHEARQHPRRKLVGMAYVELTQDNGGILLNLGEGGLAVQSALTLTSNEFPELRFQLPNMRGWLTASGRVAWMSDSKKEAGIEFLDLHEHARAQIRTWVAKEDEPEPPPRMPAMEAPRVEETLRSEAGNGATAGAGASHASIKTNIAPPPPAVTNTQEDRSFKVHDYSMFAAADASVPVWIEPPRQRRSWTNSV